MSSLAEAATRNEAGHHEAASAPATTVRVLMVAGGPNGNADLEGVTISRGTEEFLDGEAFQEALRGGLTLDQLNLRAGDQIFVPQKGRTLRMVSAVVGIAASVGWLAYRLFGN